MSVSKFVRRRKISARVAIAIAAAVVSHNVVLPNAAHAESDRDQAEVVDMYTPGVWHKLGGENDRNAVPFLALMRVEEMTGARFCKVKTRDGWYSNFVDCRLEVRGYVNRMYMADQGVMFTEGFSTFNPAYFINASSHDRGFTKVIKEAHRYILAGHHRTVVAAAEVDRTTTADRAVMRRAEQRLQYLEGSVNGQRVKLRMVIE